MTLKTARFSSFVRLAAGCLCFLTVAAVTLETGARFLLARDAVFFKVQGNDASSYRLAWVRGRGRQETGFPLSYDQYHPVRGWTPVPGLRDAAVFFDETLSTNSRGIRGKKEYSFQKPAGITRILTIGDSFTFGEGVRDAHTFSAYLQRMLPGAEVINLGVHGYGHDQILLYLQEEGRRYHPDVVILGFLYYDLERNLFSFRDYAKPRFVGRDKNLKLSNVPVPKPGEILSREKGYSKAADLWTIYYNRLAWEHGWNDQVMQQLGTALLERIQKTIEEMGAEPVFVYFPTERDFDNFYDKPSEREAYFHDFCDAHGKLHCLSVRPYFLSHLKKGRDLVIYGHWDKKGHLLTALALRDFLHRVGLVKDSAHQRMTFSRGAL